MNKRILAAVLWFFAAWYGWAIVAEFIGLPALIGPMLGIAAAALIAGDPFHAIWTERARPVKSDAIVSEAA
jgi:hypothetical protein